MPSAEQIRLAPDLDKLRKQLNEDSELFSRILKGQKPPAPPAAAKAIIGNPFESMRGGEVADAPVEEAAIIAIEPVSIEQHTLENNALDIIVKVQTQGENADLTPEEENVFEAIIHAVGRPALFISGGSFINPSGQWDVLNQHRAAIETNFKSIGRIEVAGHPQKSWWGTGFLVADDVVITNRHVAKHFCHQDEAGVWHIRAGMTPRIDFIEEVGVTNSAEFELTAIIGIHSSPDCDVALFRMSQTSPSGAVRPAPLVLAKAPTLGIGRNVYVVGYPAFDIRSDVSSVIRIFGNTYEVKRLQPGEIRGTLDQPPWFMHDCSTLGGNSGSCVVDLETNKVLGLHFKGSYLDNNFAVALWRLQDDPLIKAAKLNYR